jgi:hypothetical protein
MKFKDLIENIINNPNALLINENKDIEYALINDCLSGLDMYEEDIVFPERFYFMPEFFIRVLLHNSDENHLSDAIQVFGEAYSEGLPLIPQIKSLFFLYLGQNPENLDKDSSEQIILQYIKEHNYSPKILFPLLYPKFPVDDFYDDMGLGDYYKDVLIANCDLLCENETEKKDLLHNYFYYDLFTENKLHLILSKYSDYKNYMYYSLLNNEPYMFHYLPESIKVEFVKIHNPELILMSQKGANLIYYMNRNLDSNLLKKAIFQNHNNMLFAPENIKNDFEFANELLAKQGMLLQYFSDNIKANRDAVLIAVTQNGDALQYAHEDLRSDLEVICAALFYRGNDPSHPAKNRNTDNYVKNWNCLRWAIIHDLTHLTALYKLERINNLII